MTDVEQTFELVVICTANRFRSPVAEAFMRSGSEGLPVEIRSFGLRASGAIPPITGAIEEAAVFGVDVSRHRCRALAGEDLGDADLVLGFESLHVAEAVVECGAPRERAFTMLELTSLLERIEQPLLFDAVERWRRVVARAHLARGSAPPTRALDFPDPLAGPESAYPTVVAHIKDLSDRIVAGLFAPAQAAAARGRRS